MLEAGTIIKEEEVKEVENKVAPSIVHVGRT